MKLLHFDSVGGASGDMILGALGDLGADLHQVEAALQSLDVEPIHLHAEVASSHGLNGLRVHVHTRENEEAAEEHAHDAPQGHAHHAHDHAPHRGLREIEALIGQTALPAGVKARALAVFTRLAEAEAQVHRVPVEQVHFHEVGALDSMADIVGSCYALHLLGVEQVTVGPLPLGCGTVRCQHGEYPVPAPATLLLLAGAPVIRTTVPHELVTPTGAALLMTWKTAETPPAGSRMVRAGYGFGRRTLGDRPNVLRAVLMESSQTAETETCLALECNLDDCTPEVIGAATRRLLAAGALDVFTAPVFMKKQRPGVVLTVLARPQDREALLDLLFRETTTLGVRESLMTRTVLARETLRVATAYGEVRVKVGRRNEAVLTVSPEMDDCERLGAERGTAAREVYAAAVVAARERLAKPGRP